MPELEVLIKWGAKDSVLIAQGEYWRFITPIILHGGLIHYAFNNWALYSLGYQIESFFKERWYLAIYLFSGLGGNVLSTLVSTAPSVGASSSLFGLLGAGFYLERHVKKKMIQQSDDKKPGSSIYASMLIINIAIGFMIPQIDNAAHIGGLVIGVALSYAWICLRPKNLVKRDKNLARLSFAFVFLFIVGIGAVSSSAKLLIAKLSLLASNSTDGTEQFRYLSQMVELSPNDPRTRLLRLELSLKYGKYTSAQADLRALMQQPSTGSELDALEARLERLGLTESAVWLKAQRSEYGAFL